MAGKTCEECMEEACQMGIAASEASTSEEAAVFLGRMAAWLELAKLRVPGRAPTGAEGVDAEAGEGKSRRAR